ncbi:hypothetical protein QN382_21155 [Pseudomonas sp. 10B1]|uniref:hypothetical protein n=1 Tax=unclassified Pseudomonas TaxID=196821 RepID=UPI002AB52820|nr:MULTISPECIES: hypothetical protein [unclassified Pseudomonas]MDY7559424.1 hypothetical protein [Pseudomonas sp. AB6]MEA9977225.1 hypothetical protein [Pseudomonas sp. RTS4]MEA9995622.1 hypothetical protein [Pseudomonas sp. AA4]MEB0087943.1 hypothetical protein [Pseudomonas sp. RTI1]MEB0127045.1 hypothetical protein [Pseudomonas sp. CCC1.2]
MLINTASIIVNPCDDEYDDMAMLSCHGETGDLFLLTRFPDETQVEITVGDDKSLELKSLKATLSAERLLIEIDPEDAKQLEGHTEYEIRHGMSGADLQEVAETLQLILDDVGTYVSEID